MVENIVSETKVGCRPAVARLTALLVAAALILALALTLAPSVSGASGGWPGLCERPAVVHEEATAAPAAAGVSGAARASQRRWALTPIPSLNPALRQ